MLFIDICVVVGPVVAFMYFNLTYYYGYASFSLCLLILESAMSCHVWSRRLQLIRKRGCLKVYVVPMNSLSTAELDAVVISCPFIWTILLEQLHWSNTVYWTATSGTSVREDCVTSIVLK